MTAPLTVLHLAGEMHPAGSTVSILLLARAQRAAGHRVLVGCPPGSALGARSRAAGLDTRDLDFSRVAAAARDVTALTAAQRVDVVNAHASPDRAACRHARFARRLPAALVMTRRGMPRSSWVSALASGLAADRVIAVSRPVARALVRRGTPAGRVRVVHNAVDLDRLGPAPSRESVDRARRLAGAEAGRATIGVVARRKDQDVLLRALPMLARPVTVCCLGITADDALARLARTAAARGHRVTFVPFQDDVRPFYALFDVAALPSRDEGLSQALLEAMALGVPVVATRAGGNPEALTDGEHGLLVPARDPKALARALDRLLRDPVLRERVRASARLRVLSEFSIARTADATDAVYREALARRVA